MNQCVPLSTEKTAFYNAQAEKMSDKSYKLGFVKLSTKEYLASVEAKKLALKNKGIVE